jgi:uncharacterized protein YndB with AHSA1/START domain
MRFEQVVVVAAPPERVWEILAEWERYPEWMPDVAWVRRIGQAEGVGMRLAVRTKAFGVPLVTDELVVATWEPPRRMVVEHRGLVHGVGEWVIEPLGDGTRFTWIEELRMPPPVLGAFALFLYSPMLRWNFSRSMRKLARRTSAVSG